MKNMKTLPSRSSLLSSLVSCSSVAALALSAASVKALPSPGPYSAAKEISPYTVTERGPHHRVWSRVTAETNALGQLRYHTNSYTELTTGMHVKRNGQWVEASEEIEITPNGAVAGKGQHEVKFDGNINSSNAVELTTPDGKKLKSRILGLSYFDTSTGKSVLIAELKDSHGELLPTKNQVLYPDAFTDFRADVRYTYSLSGFEQDIILREQPPSPSEYGLNPQTTHLQVLTEFSEAPEPRKEEHGGRIKDEQLDFGIMKMGHGRAFSIGDESTSVPVGKQWTHLNGRTFLVEEVVVKSIGDELEALPKPPSSSNSKSSRNSVRHQVFNHRVLPEQKLADNNSGSLKLASVSNQENGVVLDYTIINGSLSSYTFQSDTTYYVSGTVNLSGTTTFEGGTVIKYTNYPTAKLSLSGPQVFKTGPYRPAVFTSKDDNSVGESISGSNSKPSNSNGATFLETGGSQNATVYKYLRMSYAGKGISSPPMGNSVWHSQFVKCGIAYAYTDDGGVALKNVLFSGCSTNLFMNGNAVAGENLTMDGGLLTSISEYAYLTNCILTAVNNAGTVSLNSSVSYPSSTGIYRAVGGASYYLADSSPNRNAGTANIDSALIADLRQKTTYPPQVVNNTTISANTTYSPQVQRDTDTLDLGFHYDPLDWVFGAALVANATITFNPGTAVGTYTPSGYGLILTNNAQLIAKGTPTNLIHITRYNTVQEASVTTWNSVNPVKYAVSFGFLAPGTAPLGQFRFVDWSQLAADSHFKGAGGSPSSFVDCQLHGGKFFYLALAAGVTNCLFERTYFDLDNIKATSFDAALQNCTFWYGTCVMDDSSGGTFTITDTLFDHTTILENNTILVDDYNGFFSGANRLSVNGAHDVILTSLAYSSGPLGNYYQPGTSTLINAGSTTADLVGLYHYTTITTPLAKEQNSKVDIGYHYVALDANAKPIDSDGDGLADYFEDSNGSGNYESAADLSNWNVADTDGDGLNDSEEYFFGTNPKVNDLPGGSPGLIHIHTPLQ